MKNTTLPFPKGILFDMDGVLLLTAQPSKQSWLHVCQQFAPELGLHIGELDHALQQSLEVYKNAIANDESKQQRDRLEPFVTRCEVVESALRSFQKNDQFLAAKMVQAYETRRDTHRQVAPHAYSTLQKLRTHAFSLALISNGNAAYQRKKIQEHSLASFFDFILIEEEFGYAKPDKHIFLEALSRLQISAEEAWMIGDDLYRDIGGSQQLGITALWFDPSYKGLPKDQDVHPDAIIQTLPDILTLLQLPQ